MCSLVSQRANIEFCTARGFYGGSCMSAEAHKISHTLMKGLI